LNKNRLTFGKDIKLCSLKRISEVFGNGKNHFSYPLKVFYMPNGGAPSKVLISVPKRAFKRAVERNMIKRKIRESLRLKGFGNPGRVGYDMCVVYIGKELPLYDKLDQKLKDALDKIEKNLEKDTDTPLPAAD